MLKGINKILTGDMLKVLCDMGHGDVLIISDANFPGETVAKQTTYGKLLHCSGSDVNEVLGAIVDIFPLDVAYTDYPACVMELTDGDKAKGMKTPAAWADFEKTLGAQYDGITLGKIERFEFYERAKKAYAVIETGEERQYGNILLVKGCVL